MAKKMLFLVSVMVAVLCGATALSAQDADHGALVNIVVSAEKSPGIDISVNGNSIQIANSNDYENYALKAGTYTISLDPLSKTLKLDPIKLDLREGDQYLIDVAWATADEKALTIRVIDEVKLAGHPQADVNSIIYVNDLVGLPAVDMLLDGKAMAQNIAYGQVVLIDLPAITSHSWVMTPAGDPKTILAHYGTWSFFEPQVYQPIVLTGHYPGVEQQDFHTLFGWGTTTNNAWDFLSVFDQHQVGTQIADSGYYAHPDVWHFNTFLKAAEAAGLKDLLTGNDRITVFAPTDAAFDRLLPGQLDAWLAHPDALKQVLLGHIVQGAVLNPQQFGDSPLKAMSGRSLVIDWDNNGNFRVNKQVTGYGNYYNVGNGRVIPIDTVFLPDEASATPAPTVEATAATS